MNISWARAAALSVVAVLSAGGFSSAQETADDRTGRELFTDFQCWQCHGYEGQGGAAVRIAPTAYPFEAFVQLVRHTNLMPAYSPNVLSDAQLREIYDFIRSQPEPPAVEDIPELRDL
jgi:mono/diheme cytochrome c family protein